MSSKNSDSDISRRSGRMGKPKVRTGCITCKIRRVKCDEGKPFCSRCSSTGRRCDGYAPAKRSNSAQGNKGKDSQFPPVTVAIKFSYPNSLPAGILDYPESTPEELRSLQFFQLRTADKLAKWMVKGFWKYQLPQVAYHEPSVRHSIIAMASIHEEMELCEANGTDPRFFGTSDARQRYSAQHAHLAMSELSKLLSARPESTEVALINCILFVMLDYMVGNFATAVLHLHNGQEILEKWRREYTGHGFLSQNSLRDNMAQLIFQLGFRSGSTEDDDSKLQAEIDNPELHPFPDVKSARRSIKYLTREGLRIVRIGTVMSLSKQNSPSRLSVNTEVVTQRARLERWRMKFDSRVTSLQRSTHMGEDEIIEELKIMHVSAFVWLELGISFDHPQSTERLGSVVDMAQSLHQKRCIHKHEYLSAHFVFEDNLSPPICFIATQSHVSDMRPRTIALSVTTTVGSDNERHGSVSPRPFLADNMGSVIEETTDNDGKRLVEIQVEPMTTQLSLTFIPGYEKALWEVRTDSEEPGQAYTNS